VGEPERRVRLEEEGVKEGNALQEGAGLEGKWPTVLRERGDSGGDGADRWGRPGSERARG
jgi:hypothetical protein